MADKALHNVVGGFASGAVGGLVGGVVKLLCEAIAPPRPPDREAEPAILWQNIMRQRGREPSPDEKNTAALCIHYAFSTLSGGLYGALAEIWPRIRAGSGTAFGISVWAGAHEVVMPALRLSPPTLELRASEQVNEFLTHALWGGTVESTRRVIRKVLVPRAG